MTKMQMPGYDVKVAVDKYNAECIAAERAYAKSAEKKMYDKKIAAVNKFAPGRTDQDNYLPYFALGVLQINAAGIALGSVAWICAQPSYTLSTYETWEDSENNKPKKVITGQMPTAYIYGDMPYSQAIKNAYLFDDMLHNRGGVFQAICGILVILLSLGYGAHLGVKAAIRDKDRKKEVEELLKRIDGLKEHVGSCQELLLVQDLGKYAYKLIARMSELDRGYMDNLLNGGLREARYEVAAAVVAGYLKSHPKDYQELIKVIDEATLPPDIVKKYGKGKIVSFGALKSMFGKSK